jgi:hypothetical protein
MKVDQLHFSRRVAPGPVRMPFQREVFESLTRKVDVPPLDFDFLKLAAPQRGRVEAGQG